MINDDEMLEKAKIDLPITREDLGIQTESSEDGMNCLPEGFDLSVHLFSFKSTLKKDRIKSLYNTIINEIYQSNKLGLTTYAFDRPNIVIPEEVICILSKKGIKCNFCKETNHWHFTWD